MPQSGHESGLSIYKDDKIDQFSFAIGMKDLKSAFPRLSADWFDLLKKRVIDNGFTKKRFFDAVNYTIDNSPYPEPAIAQILNYDKKIKTFTYDEVLDHNNRFPNSMKDFKKLNNGKWIRIEDADKI